MCFCAPVCQISQIGLGLLLESKQTFRTPRITSRMYRHSSQNCQNCHLLGTGRATLGRCIVFVRGESGRVCCVRAKALSTDCAWRGDILRGGKFKFKLGGRVGACGRCGSVPPRTLSPLHQPHADTPSSKTVKRRTSRISASVFPEHTRTYDSQGGCHWDKQVRGFLKTYISTKELSPDLVHERLCLQGRHPEVETSNTRFELFRKLEQHRKRLNARTHRGPVGWHFRFPGHACPRLSGGWLGSSLRGRKALALLKGSNVSFATQRQATREHNRSSSKCSRTRREDHNSLVPR